MDKAKYFEECSNLKLKSTNVSMAQVLNTKFDFNILALSVNGCLNIGNMLRTANLNGVKRFFIFGKRNYDRRSAINAYKHVQIIRVSKDFPDGIEETESNEEIKANTKTKLEPEDYLFDSELFVKIMNKYNMVPVFIEQSNQSIKFNQLNWKYQLEQIPPNKEICLIMGNELYGVPDNIIQTKFQFNGSFSIEIPQTGIINSYNVSNCAAIIMNSLFNYYIKKIHDIYL